ncbi:energy transducer TonB [Phreatobacter sp.]|uniref:energy transducer TonB family protein n=1 Tax=Phreatobacter sp. TaxID=1966341 RepID=UPI0022C64979|nr:energy transducer TonB [Phreatobacter sp.]MCZ8316094.1 energy transducer TonB [Phreatobacter sp.]
MRLDTEIAVLDAPAPQGVAVPAVRVAAVAVEGAVAPAVAALVAAPSAETAPLPVVPEGTAIAVASRWRLLLAITAIASVALHGVVIAAFMTMSTTPQRADLPAVEVEMVEADAEPPPAAAAAATEAMPVKQPPDMAPAEIALPPMEEIPLPADLMPPPVAEAPAPPVEVAEAPPPPQPEPMVERPIVIEPPAEIPALSAELTPPRPPPVAVPAPVQPIVQPRREPPRPVVRREEPARERVARPAPPRPPSPPSAASEGRGVTARATPRTSSPPPSYLALVMAQLHRAKPASAGQTGRAVVRFSILRSGAAGGVSLASSSGNTIVDQAAVAMVRRAAPFPPLPAEYGPAAMPLTVPVAFR